MQNVYVNGEEEREDSLSSFFNKKPKAYMTTVQKTNRGMCMIYLKITDCQFPFVFVLTETQCTWRGPKPRAVNLSFISWTLAFSHWGTLPSGSGSWASDRPNSRLNRPHFMEKAHDHQVELFSLFSTFKCRNTNMAHFKSCAGNDW